jgi:hypothetical protein
LGEDFDELGDVGVRMFVGSEEDAMIVTRPRLSLRVGRAVRRHRIVAATAAAVMAVVFAFAAPAAAASTQHSFISQFSTISVVGSTMPANGDVNPYGVAVEPHTVGALRAGHVLVSNFNNGANAQGTGTTIVDLAPNGGRRVFAHIRADELRGRCPGGIGLTTALSILPGGWVVVGSLPTSDGTAATARAGCLIVLDRHGHINEVWSGGPINGPWDMTAVPTRSGAALFVTNVLNGTVAAQGAIVHRGTVVRIIVRIEPGEAPERVSTRVIATGFAERTDPGALVVGPTGVAVGGNGSLYVADAVNNRIAEINNPMSRSVPAPHGGETVTQGQNLNAPLGLVVAPDGHILTVNGDDGNLVETTPGGTQLAPELLDNTGGPPPGSGALFGLVLAPHHRGIYFVDDAANTLNLLH